MSSDTLILKVPGMTCGHCEAAITTGVTAVAGVTGVEVDLDTKLVTVHGTDIDRPGVIAAIDEAGFDIEE